MLGGLDRQKPAKIGLSEMSRQPTEYSFAEASRDSFGYIAHRGMKNLYSYFLFFVLR